MKVVSNIPTYIANSIVLDGPDIRSITIYAIPQMAIHQNCIIVKKRETHCYGKFYLE